MKKYKKPFVMCLNLEEESALLNDSNWGTTPGGEGDPSKDLTRRKNFGESPIWDIDYDM